MLNKMARPDFLIVGHPRCGTTFLNGFLARHPGIFMGPKELHYFGSDLAYDDPPRSLPSYEGLLAGGRPGQLVGEASTWLLHSQAAAGEAARYRPELKIVACVREPVSWIRSVHAMLVHHQQEPELDLGVAVDALEARRSQPDLTPWARPVTAVRYRDLVHYTADLGRWIEAFGRSNVHVLVAEELFADPALHLVRLLEFLGVSTTFPGFADAVRGSRAARNAGKTWRSRRIQRLVDRPSSLRIQRRLEPGGALPRLALRILRRTNIRYQTAPPVDPALSARLHAEFEPERQRIEALLGRRISSWR
jgi:hypothetical protein